MTISLPHGTTTWATVLFAPSVNGMGIANYRLVRYADDLMLVVSGTRDDAERLQEETRIAHIDEGGGLPWLAHPASHQEGNHQTLRYTSPSKRSLLRIVDKVRQRSRFGPDVTFTILLYRLNSILRGWANYFKHGVSLRHV